MAINNLDTIRDLVQRALAGNAVFEKFNSAFLKCRLRRAGPEMPRYDLTPDPDPWNKFFASGAPAWSDSFLVSNVDAIPRELILGRDGEAYQLPN